MHRSRCSWSILINQSCCVAGFNVAVKFSPVPRHHAIWPYKLGSANSRLAVGNFSSEIAYSFHVLPKTLRKLLQQHIKTGHDLFIPHPFQIIHIHPNVLTTHENETTIKYAKNQSIQVFNRQSSWFYFRVSEIEYGTRNPIKGLIFQNI